MNRIVTVLIIIMVLGVAGFFTYNHYIKPKAVRIIGIAERFLPIMERVLPLLEANTEAIDSIFKYLDAEQPFYDEFKSFIEKQTKHNQSVYEKLDKLPGYEIPEIDYVHPDTYEDCIEELDKSRETSQQLIEIINIQKEEISLLRTINTSQALMVERYHEALEKKELDMDLLRGVYGDFLSEAKRLKIVGYTFTVLGIVIAIAL